MKITILVATHKMYNMPDNPIYFPVWAGAEVSKTYNGQFCGDNTGDNISDRNPSYNELSVLYWGWKNCKSEIKGLVHYRRFFASQKCAKDYSDILSGDEIDRLLRDYDVIVTEKRKFHFMSTYNHYVFSQAEMKKVHKHDLDTLKDVISRLYPQYLPALKTVYRNKSAHMLNMFIMKDKLFNEYCEWLFNILGEMENSINRFRVLGAMGEFLLDVFILTNNLRYVEKPLLELERTPFLKKLNGRILRMIKKENE